MEMSTGSPPPTSPTAGDDPCWTDVTNAAIGVVTLLICLCGLVGNGAVLWLLGFCIRKNPTIVYILNLAVADFVFLLFAVPFTVIYLLEEVSCSAIMPLMYPSLLFAVSVLSYNVGLYLLTAISIERCRSILCPLCCRCHCPQYLSVVVCDLLMALAISVMATVMFLCQSQQQEHCQVARTCMYALNLLLFASAMVISSTVLFVKVKGGSQQQQLKKLDIIIFLMVLFALSLSLCNFLQQLGYTVMSSQVVFLLACIHCTIKPFIYFSMGSCRRPCSMGSLQVSLRRVFEEPEENTPSSNDAAMDTAVSAC